MRTKVNRIFLCADKWEARLRQHDFYAVNAISANTATTTLSFFIGMYYVVAVACIFSNSFIAAAAATVSPIVVCIAFDDCFFRLNQFFLGGKKCLALFA